MASWHNCIMAQERAAAPPPGIDFPVQSTILSLRTEHRLEIKRQAS